MNTARSTRDGFLHLLFWLLLANALASILHYGDNLLYFEEYPEPGWINRSIIDAFWFVMTPFALIGYQAVKRGQAGFGGICLYLYAAGGLLVLGHYRYAPMCSIVPRIHALILLEAGLAVALVAVVLVHQIRGTSRIRA
ncbi:hypothetical protein [Rudaea sp.]|uniref:hypothetical protein n=1 Tax=Rudaea sp. TaxID=2136325 RepID=UPI0032200F13